jgi:uncharacterized protein (TIGR00369 family)
MLTPPPDFQPHFRKSPVTDPWEPLYSRRRQDGIDLCFEVRAAHCNSRGFLHGGVLAALCDNVMGLSLGSVLNNANANIVTLTLTLDYLGSAAAGDCILIEPRVIRAGSSIGVCDALAKCSDRIIARANATFSVRSKQTDDTNRPR